MKKAAFWLLCAMLLFALAAVASGCSREKNAASVKIGETCTIGVGESVRIRDADLRVTFGGVSGDSRCPKDVICVWAGEVTCSLAVDYRGSTYTVTLKEPGLTDSAEDTFFEYSLAYHITPYPVSTQPISAGDYQLTLTVKRSPEGASTAKP